VGLVNDKIEIRVFDSVGTTHDNLIQVIPNLQRARFLIRGKQGLLFVASVSHLWCIQAVDVAEQTKHLLQEKNFQLALQLTVSTHFLLVEQNSTRFHFQNISDESEEQKTEKIHQIQYQYACDLFLNKKFRESMAEFQKLKTDPMKVIALFPFLLPGEGDKKSKLTDKDLENGLLALIDYLTHTRYAIKGELSGPGEKKPTFGKDSKALLPIIDTTLLKCYLQTNDSFVAPLLRLGHCHLKESEKVLIEHNKFGELKILYETKGDHNLALRLLKTQANVSC
jgi:Vam6/Vps39-like protein vacuolar protein sorting-associated protein 39